MDRRRAPRSPSASPPRGRRGARKKRRTSQTPSARGESPIAARLRQRSRRRPPRYPSLSGGNSGQNGQNGAVSARSERYKKRRERQGGERERSRSRDRRRTGSRTTRSRSRSRSRRGSSAGSSRRRHGRRSHRVSSHSRQRHHDRYETRYEDRRRPSRSPQRNRRREHQGYSRRHDSYDSGYRERRHSSRDQGYTENGAGYDDDNRSNGTAGNNRDASDDSAAHDDSVGTYEGRPGDYILSRYKILREAGVGTFGRVLECVDKKRNLIVAIKVVRKVEKYTESAKIEANILQDVNDKDKRNESLCVRMYKWFEYKGHVCMVFERLGCSLYDYLKNHDYKPFPIRCIRAYAWQLLTALEYCHRIKLIHTDLKPENILLVDDEEEPWGGRSRSSSSSSSSVDSGYGSDRDQWSNNRQWRKRDLASSQTSTGHSESDSQRAVLRPPASNAVKLIDFGGATYDYESKSSIINTRQYRSPEVILGLGWSYPSDIWSAGCIIAELYLGELLFATHENMEHLALIEQCIGRLPPHMADTASKHQASSKFFSRGRLNWPARASSDESVDHVRKMRSLEQLILPEDARAGLADLLQLMLTLDPDDRVTAKEALSHPFFEGFTYKDVGAPTLVDNGRREGSGSSGRRSQSWGRRHN